ncbi:UdgX family uracil-DNA binding protein [Paracoccus pantotrophus]|uniref:Type-4 uracil-DNA glycosylase n=1 Tax=Paracoccus pantotrophus TaxID=82367 RepID=A0A7H9BXH4_PARPN|nr:UdgX family uracil-DNA binding protein [Paracoccus pantotrophus]QLH16097.1 UdgX family uracil-DNA binding protein [Paracoccus pantotrophus]
MIHRVRLPERGLFEAWRSAARIAISHRIAPEDIDWSDTFGLFEAAPLPDQAGPHQARVPPAFLRLAGSVIWHSAPERLGLLYQALWRIDRQQGDPLSQADPLGRRLNLMAKSVGRDIHKMHAFVRFRELPRTSRRRFAAWFEPEHDTLEPGSAFFVKRFADMDWIIASPRLTARYEAGKLSFHPGSIRPDLPKDASQELWATYYANIFNPARVKLAAMRAEMPKKYWKNLPETRLIPDMLKDAEARVARMHAAAAGIPRPGALPVSPRYRAAMPVPADLPDSLDAAGKAALQCRRCQLCEAATQTVWGEGAPSARLMLVGEQPGDREDLEGRPFVGPAGLLLREVMSDAGINPHEVWLTNAVKHFKFTPRGKKRLHQNPDRQEILHCRWWLRLELSFIRPELVVAFGASAAFALTGNAAPLTPRRGRIETGLHGGPVLITWHPSAILRQKSEAAMQLRRELAGDLASAASFAPAI